MYNQASFISEGRNPYSFFQLFSIEHSITYRAQTVLDLLGDRICFMSYSDKYDPSYPFTSIVAVCLLDPTNEIVRFARYLRKITPNCKYPNKGRQIHIHDEKNPYNIKSFPENYDDEIIFQNTRWRILVRNNGGGTEPVDIFIAKTDML